jgi:hypothetical protein
MPARTLEENHRAAVVELLRVQPSDTVLRQLDELCSEMEAMSSSPREREECAGLRILIENSRKAKLILPAIRSRSHA